MTRPDEAPVRHVRRLALKLGGLLVLSGVALAAILIFGLVRLGGYHGATGGAAVLGAAAVAGAASIAAVVAALRLHASREHDLPISAKPTRAPVSVGRNKRAFIIMLTGVVALGTVLVVRLCHARAVLPSVGAGDVTRRP